MRTRRQFLEGIAGGTLAAAASLLCKASPMPGAGNRAGILSDSLGHQQTRNPDFDSTPLGCDTFVAMPDATADRSVLLAKNSDRPPMEAQVLVQFPHERHAPGEMLKCTYIEIPQASETYEHIGSKLWWAYGYEEGMNEYGVAIGNEAVFSKEPARWGDGLLGMDLLRLGLERGKTAYEAMHVMIELLEKYGQSGDCEHPGEWGHANYDNSYILADPHDAWVFETAGYYWAAKRVERGVYSISNIYTIERDWNEAHPRLVEHAIEMGWTRSAKDFNFTRDYGDYWQKGGKNPAGSQIRRNMTLSCLRHDVSHVTPAAMMAISRSHLQGTIAAPRWTPPESFWPTPCMHDIPQSPYHTAASFVAHLRPQLPPLLRQVYWASFSNPCCNVFKPFYLHGPAVPASYAIGTSTYSAESPWWWANRLKLLCDLNYRAVNPTIRSMLDQTERWEMARQPSVEAAALKEAQAGRVAGGVALLQQFINENCERVQSEYRKLNQTQPEMIARDDVEYLYTDYLKAWTSKKGVPLPLH
ncbi:MAG: C69 family dipeptidase [Terriglobia bacterium]